MDYLKWIRYYLDFCAKYRYPPRDRDSLSPWINKLAEKRQDGQKQACAAAAVGVYYAVVEHVPSERRVEAGLAESNEPAWDACYTQLKAEVRLRGYSPKTLQTYQVWIRQFERYLKGKRPDQVNSNDAKNFLSHLAVDRHVAASTQNQAFNALLFLYRHILKAEYDLKDKVVRAKKTKYIPVVLTRKEVDQVLKGLNGAKQLACSLLYACGLRQSECLNLRIQCLNLDNRILTVHDGKGRKDRTVPLPEGLLEPIAEQMEKVAQLLEQDLEREDYAGVFLPDALGRKYAGAAREFPWQWLFPAKTLTLVPEDGEYRRYHVHETQMNKAIRMAVRKAKLTKRVTAHTFRHTFASHLLQANYDIRTIQEMLGHADVRTTMIYTHTVPSRTKKERQSPYDFTQIHEQIQDM